MRTTSIQLFTNFAMTQDGYSVAFDLEMVTGYSIQAVWTGTPIGILFIQASNDFTTPPTTWSVLDPSILNIDGAASNHLWKQHMAAFRWIRLGYAFGSSTGILNARLSCKGTD